MGNLAPALVLHGLLDEGRADPMTLIVLYIAFKADGPTNQQID